MKANRVRIHVSNDRFHNRLGWVIYQNTITIRLVNIIYRFTRQDVLKEKLNIDLRGLIDVIENVSITFLGVDQRLLALSDDNELSFPAKSDGTNAALLGYAAGERRINPTENSS